MHYENRDSCGIHGLPLANRTSIHAEMSVPNRKNLDLLLAAGMLTSSEKFFISYESLNSINMVYSCKIRLDDRVNVNTEVVLRNAVCLINTVQRGDC